MILPLVLLFIAVPIVEIYVIIQVGQAIGALWTIALLVADSILGSMLMRAQGRAAWRRFNQAIAAGRVPTREVLDGVLVIFGRALLFRGGEPGAVKAEGGVEVEGPSSWEEVSAAGIDPSVVEPLRSWRLQF